MIFSRETQEKINQFAKEQSRHYLDAAEMTYLEKLRAKAGQTKEKIGQKVSRFKRASGHAIEAQSDMVLFMSDYMNDLMSKGLSEQQALEKATEELAALEKSDLSSDLQEHFQQYYRNQSPAAMEAIGLIYGGFLLVGTAIGALTGYILSGGRQEFVNGGWIDTLVWAGAGALLGIGGGTISHAFITIRSTRRERSRGGKAESIES